MHGVNNMLYTMNVHHTDIHINVQFHWDSSRKQCAVFLHTIFIWMTYLMGENKNRLIGSQSWDF